MLFINIIFSLLRVKNIFLFYIIKYVFQFFLKEKNVLKNNYQIKSHILLINLPFKLLECNLVIFGY